MKKESSAIELLSKPIQRLLKERGFHKLTEPQEKAIPVVLSGKNVLLIAPTGTGKTEAVVLPVLQMFLEWVEKPPGIKILYITPLRALNRDLLERLEWWCEKLGVKVAVRHGDTEVSERSKQAKSPPDMLITTPETLQAILPGKVMSKHLRAVRWVIVDEVHELACDKRGSQLSLALERVRWIAKRDFQVIGLSATIGTPERVAKFLVGTNRECEIVRVPVARKIKLEVLYPAPEPQDFELAAKVYTHPEVAARLRVMREIIEKHQSVLLFTNTRAIAEVLASRFRVWDMDFPISIHHGSLAKPARISAERGLKSGALKGLVSTSSLELGIDVGRVELCIQYMSPRQVTRLIQRVGRSGHRIGRMAKGVIITMDSDDTLEAMVIARRAYREELEPVYIPEKPYDALTHQIVGLLTQWRRWRFDDILQLFRNAYPYRDLTEEDLEKVLTYMYTRYPRLAWVSFEDRVVLRPARTKDFYEYYFENLSMIPDEKQYLVIDETTDTPVGILDEAFVAEYGEPGTKFIVRGSPWKITHIYGDRIYVKPLSDPTGAIPSWVGEEIPVPFEVAMEVGATRRYVEESVKKGRSLEYIAAKLAKKYPISVEDLERALQETYEQAKTGIPVPTDKRVTVEEWGEYVIVHASFGSLVNRTLARLVGQELSNVLGQSVAVQQDPYRVVIHAPTGVSARQVAEILRELSKVDAEGVRRKTIASLVNTGLFKRRLLHVARKFGAISKHADFGSVSLNQLIKSFEQTAIFEEAVKDALSQDVDVENTVEILRRIREGEIEVCILGEGLSPIAKLGMERISRKTDLIPPEKMHRILVESARARLLNEARTFACLDCGEYVEIKQIKDLSPQPKCSVCGSTRLAVSPEAEDRVRKLLEKRGKAMSERDRRLLKQLEDSAELVSRYGWVAALVLAGKKVTPRDAKEVLAKESRVCDKLFELVLEAERKALKRSFW